MAHTPDTRRRAPTRRRTETRQRLLDAAFEVFVAKGFGRTRIDDICHAAGYTKGAFYSNFASLEELFFELYDRQSAYGADFTSEVVTSADPADVHQVVIDWASHVLIDRDWLLINTDFVSYAARFPDVAAHLAEHRRTLRAQVTDLIAAMIAEHQLRLPATLATPAALARAIVTVYDGVIYQLLLDMDERQVRAHFVDIVSALIPPQPV